VLAARVAAGDEPAFAELVRRHQPQLQRFVRVFVRRPESIEDVVQDTWLAVLRGIDKFENRASFRTWLYQIASNRARTHAARERRREEIERMITAEIDEQRPFVDGDRFLPATDQQYPLHWGAPPIDWGEHPEARILSRETATFLRAEIDRLPPVQAAVVTLRDIEGLHPRDVAQALGVSDGNQRVLLHRARTKLWRALEIHLGEAT
jgi:RNA polymerase sigma-70 factor (ECF subfamily)